MRSMSVAFGALAAFAAPLLPAEAAPVPPTAQEQLMLELVNRARLDPATEAAKFGINLNEGPPTTVITPATKQPLAMSNRLVAAARNHSADMIARGYFAHNTPEGVTPQQRADAEAYAGAVGENIVWAGVLPGPINANTAIVDHHQALFVDNFQAGRGHRLNILDNRYKEIGIGQALGTYQGFSASMVTQDFGIPNPTGRFLTGVAFNDTIVADKFYTIGEARAGVLVNAGAAVGGAAGGYSLAITNVAQNIVFSGGGLPLPITVAILAGADNVKLDVVGGTTIYSSATVRNVSGARGVTLLGFANIGITGASNAETLTGNRGANVMLGNGGIDTLIGGRGRDVMTGGAAGDIFFYNAIAETGNTPTTRDLIKDFAHLVDRINLGAIDASASIGGNNAFTWRGTAPITTSPLGELRFQQFNNAGTVNDITIVYGDIDSDVDSEFQIEFTGLINFTGADFTL